MAKPTERCIDIVHELGKGFAERACEHDNSDSFVSENYAALKKYRFFSAAIPEELGGGGRYMLRWQRF